MDSVRRSFCTTVAYKSPLQKKADPPAELGLQLEDEDLANDTVGQNIARFLKARKEAEDELVRRVEEDLNTS